MDEHVDPPTQGVFIGWLAIGLMAFMALFALTLFVAGMNG